MRKRMIIFAVSSLLAAGTLSGCAETPEESLVKMKGIDSEKNYEEASVKETSDDGEKKAQTIREIVGAPETYKSEIQDETGLLTISTDAVVEIPKAEKASAIHVSQHPFDQAAIDKVTEVFFPDAKIYSGDSYFRRTKPKILKELNKWKAYLAAGELDPNGFGKDENGDYIFDINQTIERLEAEYEAAPEEWPLEEVKPQFGLENMDYARNETWVYEDGFSGVAETENGKHFQYFLSRLGSTPFEIMIRDLTIDESLETEEYVHWSEYSSYSSLNNNIKDFPDEEELKEREKLTLEEAKSLADEKIKKLEIPYMELTAWDYGLYMGEVPEEGKDSVYDVGYILHYSRNIENIPITYTVESGGEQEDIENCMETWGYEKLTFYIGSDGISEVRFNNLYDIGEKKTEQVSLKSFDEIMKIYEKMMLIQNAHWSDNKKEIQYNIDRITFGYTRIYEPSVDSRSGVLIPVWDFFGDFTSTSNEEELAQEMPGYSEYRKDQSFLTINAIDGSVINRGLGY